MNVRVPVLLAPISSRPTFVYHHVVSFEETNVVGNVYFTRHISWQGRCREMFLKQNAPQILSDIAGSLRLVTLRVSCDYFEELRALDEIEVRMTLAYMRQHRIGLNFQIVRNELQTTIARGFQELGCLREVNGGLVQITPPKILVDALRGYMANSRH